MRRDPRDSRESGSLTLMLMALVLVLLALAGLVLDGGRKLDATQKAYAIAQEAARAGAGQVNTSTAYRSGTFKVDPAQAREAADAYLAGWAGAGYAGSVRVSGDQLKVIVHVREPTVMLSLIGIRSFTSTGSAVASLVTGVTGPGS